MIIILLLTCISLYFFHHFYWKRRNLPPGPTPWPLVGNLASIFFPPPGYAALNRWTKQYGDIYTFWLGSTPYIAINSYETLKETFVKNGDIFVAKKEQQWMEDFRGGQFGIIDANGEVWKTHRRFALINLRDLGVGKDLMQEKILLEVEDIIKRHQLDRPVLLFHRTTSYPVTSSSIALPSPSSISWIFSDMRKRDIIVYFANAKAPVRELFKNCEFYEFVPKDNFYPTLRDATAIARQRQSELGFKDTGYIPEHDRLTEVISSHPM